MTIQERIHNELVEELVKVPQDEQKNIQALLDKFGIEKAIVGACEHQQEIDIRRAVEWLKENMTTERHEMDCGRHTEEYYEATYYGKTEELINDFEQAMKGE